MPLDAAIISAIIGAGAGTANAVGGSYLQAGMNKRQMRYARELANKGLTKSDLQAFELNRQAAQETRDFALQMDSTNYQRKVADMQAAGVNPALAIGGVQAAPSSNATATAQNTGNVSPIGVNAPDFGAVAQYATLPFEIKNMREQNRLLAAEAEGKEIENKIKNEEFKVTPQRLQNSLDEQRAAIDRDSEAAKSYAAQASYTKTQESRYNEKTDTEIAVGLSQVGLNDAKAKEALEMYRRISIECTWLPKQYAASIANTMAATGFTTRDTAMMNFKYMKTVTLNDAKSMGINVLGKFGINGSTSNDTLVMIVPKDDGKSWEVVGLSSADVKDREPAPNVYKGEPLDNTD